MKIFAYEMVEPSSIIYQTAKDKITQAKTPEDLYAVMLEISDICKTNPRLDSILCHPERNLWEHLTYYDDEQYFNIDDYLKYKVRPKYFKRLLHGMDRAQRPIFVKELIDNQDLDVLESLLLLERVPYRAYIQYLLGKKTFESLLKHTILTADKETMSEIYDQIPDYLYSLNPEEISNLLEFFAQKISKPSERVLFEKFLDSWDHWKYNDFNKAIRYANNHDKNNILQILKDAKNRFPAETKYLL